MPQVALECHLKWQRATQQQPIAPFALSQDFSLLSPQAIQILIGLFHVLSAFNPHIYWNLSVLGASGYLIWGGLSVSTRLVWPPF